jgi:hypothetical protein
MNSIKTPQGTELPIRDMRGKPYLEVQYRLVWFREEHPDWRIATEGVQILADVALMRATIMNEKGEAMATAHKQEHKAHFADFIEKAETGAIGRALAMCGYGTQFTIDLDEADRIVDAPTERRRPDAEQPPAATGKVAPKGAKAGPKQKDGPQEGASGSTSRDKANAEVLRVYKLFLSRYPQINFETVLTQRYNVTETRLMTVEQLQDFAAFLQAGVNAPEPSTKAQGKANGAAPGPSALPVSDGQRKALAGVAKERGWKPDQVTAYMVAAWGVNDSKNLSAAQCGLLTNVILNSEFNVAIAEFEGGGR